MKTEINEISLNGIIYVPKDSVKTSCNKQSTDGLPYVMIRTYSAGVHIGYLKSKEYTPSGIVVQLVNTRRVYSWSGAVTLSQLANEGSKKQADCKITLEIPSNEMVAIEIMEVSEIAFENLKGVAEWKM